LTELNSNYGNLFESQQDLVYAVKSANHDKTINKLSWLFGKARLIDTDILPGGYIGPRKEMITPWSTNAVEITQNMGISGISRIEMFRNSLEAGGHFDAMLQAMYKQLDQDIFTIHKTPDEICFITDIVTYNEEGLTKSRRNNHLDSLAIKLAAVLPTVKFLDFPRLTRTCRHKIFNGTFI
jgi:phosphoribosylformylglycinamidine synthase